jgi:lysyl-tRNA synthetase class 2
MDDERSRRLAKVEELRASGTEPYPVRFDRDHTAAELQAKFADLGPGEETTTTVRVAGRVLLLRRQGGLTFATARDGSGTIQLFVSKGVIGEEQFEAFNGLDLGDWVGAEGIVMTTKRGELSVKVTAFVLLAKSLRALPDKWHGLADVDTRFRQRYVDLIVNEEARRVFEVRFRAIAAIREYLNQRGFLEVETPLLHGIAGGAAAKPFVTHYNSLHRDLTLRIALELPLKRLLVGGFEKVYEIGRCFRNEGIDTTHQPEFTMLEAYEAFADYTDMMELFEGIVAHAAREATGSSTVTIGEQTIDLTPPWPRRTMLDLIAEYTGVDVHPRVPVDELRAICDKLGVTVKPGMTSGAMVMEIYEQRVEKNLTGPVFVLDYPRDVSPLAREHRDDPFLVERFEPVVLGRELGNAFSELNDPVDQRARFEAQARLRAAGDDEAHAVDDDYVRALEYGLPPCGGIGLGVDRLAMLLAGVNAIREVILFPHLRPEQGSILGNDSP